ncbi:MAG: PorP/SprF family type IX secretion system membrane protein [Bacteroidia bacterium]
MKKHLLTLIFSVLLIAAQGQDIHFSQFPWSPLNLGPQQAGQFDGDLRLSAIHRRQWAAVTVPYKTFSGSADASLNLFKESLRMFNAGLLINHDEAGDGQMRTLDVRGFFGITLPLEADSVYFFRGGVMAGFSQRSVDFNALSFDEQFNGDVWDPLAANGENYNTNKATWLDLGLGMGFERKTENSRIHLNASATHINRPDQGFYSEAVRRPVLWQINGGGLFRLSDQLSLHPEVIWMAQESYRALNLGAEFRLVLQQEQPKNYAIGLGIFHRVKDAIIPEIALYWNKFRLGFSYDINISSLRTVSKGRGGPEFSITYITRKIRSKPQRSVVCPVY